MGVNEDYEKMLKTATIEGENSEKESTKSVKLTDDQVEELAKQLDSVPVSADTQKYIDAVNDEHAVMEMEKKFETPIINPRNGMHVLNSDPNSSKEVNYDEDINIDDIMSLDGDVDITDVKVTEESVTESIGSILPSVNLTAKDVEDLQELAERYNKGASISFYNAMPESIKAAIDVVVAQGSDFSMDKKTGRNYIATQLLDMMVEDAVNKSAIADMNIATYNAIKEMKDVSDEGLTEFFKLQKEQYEVNYPAQADEYERALNAGEVKEEDREKIETLIKNYRAAAHSFVQSYTYTDMMDAYRKGKLKVKSIQLEKIKRTCEGFDAKYLRSNMSVNSIKLTIPALDRHLPTNANISITAIQKFICVFINYTKSMQPSNVGDHVFMYYFIKNILNLDMHDNKNEEEQKFYDDLINRIWECIKEIGD